MKNQVASLPLRFGKQRAKSSDSGRLSAQERKTPTAELNYGSRAERATPVGELEEGAGRGQDEAQARMLAEQVGNYELTSSRDLALKR